MKAHLGEHWTLSQGPMFESHLGSSVVGSRARQFIERKFDF